MVVEVRGGRVTVREVEDGVVGVEGGGVVVSTSRTMVTEVRYFFIYIHVFITFSLSSVGIRGEIVTVINLRSLTRDLCIG